MPGTEKTKRSRIVENVKTIIGGVCCGLASYSASAILGNVCPKTGNWKKDLALKAGCSLIGGLVGSVVEEKVTKDIDDVVDMVTTIREEVSKMKENVVENQIERGESKREQKYVLSESDDRIALKQDAVEAITVPSYITKDQMEAEIKDALKNIHADLTKLEKVEEDPETDDAEGDADGNA